MPDLQPELSDTQKLFVTVTNQGAVLLDVKETVEHDHKFIFEGNGEVPLVGRVRQLEDYVNSVKFWTRTVAVALVLQTVTFGIAVIVGFIKFYPLLEYLATHIEVIK